MSRKVHSRGKHSASPPRRLPWLWLAIGGALLLIAGSLSLGWSSFGARPVTTPVVTGTPRLAVDRTSVDEGYVKLDTPIRTTFRLRNIGDQPLQILAEPWVELIEGC